MDSAHIDSFQVRIEQGDSRCVPKGGGQGHAPTLGDLGGRVVISLVFDVFSMTFGGKIRK